jgi:hypothetical protein
MLVAKMVFGRIHLVYDSKLIIKLDSESCTINYKAYLMHRKWTKLRPLLSSVNFSGFDKHISLHHPNITNLLCFIIQGLHLQHLIY